jgi:hypothetical protein
VTGYNGAALSAERRAYRLPEMRPIRELDRELVIAVQSNYPDRFQRVWIACCPGPIDVPLDVYAARIVLDVETKLAVDRQRREHGPSA